ncbi:MAG: oligopeptide/dipeptide ABC transporter ATP-binding protein [Acidimicrobiia bacterium]
MAGSGTAHLRDHDDVLLTVEHLVVEFPAGRSRTVHAVSDVSFDVRAGETLGLVGESGCGKSTTGRAIVQLDRATSGSVCFQGTDLTTITGEELRKTRSHLQMIFQDPISSLNPHRRILDIVIEPLSIWDIGDRASRRAQASAMLATVGLDPDVVGSRRAAQLSGGQCQRVSIARSLMLDPKLIICDEPVSALDVSVQAQVLNLLEAMKERYGLTLLFIAHDLAVVKAISDRIVVMYLGKLCEVATSAELYANPAHHYTRTLIDAIPVADPDAQLRQGSGISDELPSPLDPPSGCRFRTRCPRAEERCTNEEPQLREVHPGHYVACHFPLPIGDAVVASGVPATA